MLSCGSCQTRSKKEGSLKQIKTNIEEENINTEMVFHS